MLRAAQPLSGRAVLTPIRQRAILSTFILKRALADDTKPSLQDTKPAVLPGSQSKTATTPTPPPPGAVPPTTPSPIVSTVDKSIPPANVPLTPPPPPTNNVQTSPTSSVPPPSPPPPPPPKKKPRRFRRFLLALVLLTGLGFGGGVWYSLISDNFHDFFTEYIPFGEDAVLYFEEREFRKRFPSVLNSSHRPSGDSGAKVTIPSRSGLSWKVTDSDQKGSDLETKGRHMSAVDDNEKTGSRQSNKVPPPVQASSEKSKPEAAKKSASTPSEKPKADDAETKLSAPKANKSRSTKSSAKSTKMPEVDDPSVFIPITRIDPLKIKNADEPLVQDLVKILNDIITVVNADNSTGKFTSSITKAKNELASVGKKIMDLKAVEKKAADEKVKLTQGDFDKAARELVSRLEDQMREQESRWKDEFESERQKISQSYEGRLKSEVEKSDQLSEQRLKNYLLEQAVSLKKGFVSGIKEQVESERDGRLAKLSELSTSVSELEKLTSEWNSVLDANLRTQHLQVAVEAVRSSLERADRPRPFIRELAVLKELAGENSVVNTAIASINPTAYQFGVPTPSQLIDRFRRVADEVRKASLLPEDAGIASHAASFLLSKVMFKKQGRAVGDDVESILSRTETLLEEGNLDEAAREVNTLNGWAKALSRDWLGEVRKVLEVRQALDVISTEVRLQSLKVD